MCNFDAIVMSHEHEMSTYRRNGDRVDLPALLEIGTKFQRETGWIPPSELAKMNQPQAKDSEESGGGAAPVASGAEETEESSTSS